MAVLSGQTSVAANSTSANVLAGSPFEFAPRRRGIVTVYAAAAATNSINSTLSVGGQLALLDNLVSGANRSPIIPDDRLVRSGYLPGDSFLLTFRNITAGAVIVNWLVEIL